MPAARFNSSQNTASRRSFATTAFTYKAQGFTLIDKEADAINSPNLAHDSFEETLFDGEILLQVVNFKDYWLTIG